MKKTFFILATMAFALASCNSDDEVKPVEPVESAETGSAKRAFAEDYQKTLVDGRSWVIGEVCTLALDADGKGVHKEVNKIGEVYVEGDSIVNGVKGKRIRTIYYSGEFRPKTPIYDFAWEENGRVYEGDGKQYKDLLLDFNYNDGDRISCFVAKVDYVTVKGVKYRRISLSGSNGAWGGPYVWVEGIGCNSNWGNVLSNQCVALDGSYEFIMACYQDGKCIFEHDDFTNEGDK